MNRLRLIACLLGAVCLLAGCQSQNEGPPPFILPPMGDDVSVLVTEWHYYPTSHLYKFLYSEKHKRNPCDFDAAAMVDVKDVVQIGSEGHCGDFGGRTVWVVRLRHDWDQHP